MTQFIVCVAVLFLFAAPLFYWLTKNYYAEDMEDLQEAVAAGSIPEHFDLEQDVMQGIMLQYVLITATLGIAVVLTMRLISKHLWQPFDRTLQQIESFRLESGKVPSLPQSDIKEFTRLNIALNKLMTNSMTSYHAQKEFTENASHELQTPLAVFQSKLDILLQQPELTEQQASIIQDLYSMTARLSRLNRSLLLLAKIENRQFEHKESIELDCFLDNIFPYLEDIAGSIGITREKTGRPVTLQANHALLESMVNNLVVNAVRHNKRNGEIVITTGNDRLAISNTSDEPRLDDSHIFNRFYRPAQNQKGNGLGLAIVKAVCDYHGWLVSYDYTPGHHQFTVDFSRANA